MEIAFKFNSIIIYRREILSRLSAQTRDTHNFRWYRDNAK